MSNFHTKLGYNNSTVQMYEKNTTLFYSRYLIDWGYHSNCSMDWSFSLINTSTSSNISIYEESPSNSVGVRGYARSKDCNFDIEFNTAYVENKYMVPLALIPLSLLGCFASFTSLIFGVKRNDYYFLKTMILPSLIILIAFNVYFFGVFLGLGLEIAPEYLQPLTIASIANLFSIPGTLKLCYDGFMARNVTNPLLYSISLRSPRLRLFIILSIVILASYTLSFSTLYFPFVCYFFPIIYSFPLIHVLGIAFNSDRNSFRW